MNFFSAFKPFMHPAPPKPVRRRPPKPVGEYFATPMGEYFSTPMGALPPYEAQAGGMQMGPGRALRDGSLGSPMQRGEGSAYREGSLGMSLSFTDSNIIAAALGGILAMVLWKKKVTKPGFLGIT